jgi:hypothetical protein
VRRWCCAVGQPQFCASSSAVCLYFEPRPINAISSWTACATEPPRRIGCSARGKMCTCGWGRTVGMMRQGWCWNEIFCLQLSIDKASTGLAGFEKSGAGASQEKYLRYGTLWRAAHRLIVLWQYPGLGRAQRSVRRCAGRQVKATMMRPGPG